MNPMKARIDQPSRPRKTPQAMSLTLILMRGSEVGKTSGGSVNAGLLWPGVRPYQGGGPPLRGDSGVTLEVGRAVRSPAAIPRAQPQREMSCVPVTPSMLNDRNDRIPLASPPTPQGDLSFASQLLGSMIPLTVPSACSPFPTR